MPRTPHKAELERIRSMLEDLGGFCYVLSQVGRLRGSAGIPDLHCFLNVHGEMCVFWCEVKATKRDHLSPAQEQFKLLSEAAGVDVVVGTADDVGAYLEDIFHGENSVSSGRG